MACVQFLNITSKISYDLSEKGSRFLGWDLVLMKKL
jgi:hypothetical protein